MKKLPLLLVLITLLSLSLTGCMNANGPFIGTWRVNEGGGSITFYENNTVSINQVGQFLDLSLLGLFTYSVQNNNITFASRGNTGIYRTFGYEFINASALRLYSGQVKITLTKVR